MGKIFFRVDDRLIHGQITTAWTQYLDIKRILVVDDKTASNSMIKSIVTMAAPPQFKTKIVKVDEASKVILENVNLNLNQLVIFKKPEIIDKLCSKDYKIEKIIIGTVAKSNDTVKQLNQNVFLSQKDIDILNHASNAGYEIEIRMLPSNKPSKWQ